MVEGLRRTDRILVERCLAGDAGAWDDLTRLFSSTVRDAVRRTLARFALPADPGRVDDLTQEAFLQLLKDGAQVLRLYRGDGPLASYLHVVASYRIIDLLRKEGAPVPVPLDPDGRPLWRERLLHDATHFRDSLPDAELRLRLDAALLKLPGRERLILKAFYWDGLSTSALARLLDITQNHATVLLSRARKQLRELLHSTLAL